MENTWFVPLQEDYTDCSDIKFMYIQYSYIRKHYAGKFRYLVEAYKKWNKVPDRCVAVVFGVNQSMVSLYRNGKALPFQRQIPKFAKILHIEPVVLAYIIVRELWPFEKNSAAKVLIMVNSYALGQKLDNISDKVDFSLTGFKTYANGRITSYSLRKKLFNAFNFQTEDVENLRSFTAYDNVVTLYMCYQSYCALLAQLEGPSDDAVSLFSGKYTEVTTELLHSFVSVCTSQNILKFSDLLYEFCKISKMSEKELSVALHCGTSTLNCWLHDICLPDSSLIHNIAGLLQIHPLMLSALMLHSNVKSETRSVLYAMVIVCTTALGKSFVRFFNSTSLKHATLINISEHYKNDILLKQTADQFKEVLGLTPELILRLRKESISTLTVHYQDLINMYNHLLTYCNNLNY